MELREHFTLLLLVLILLLLFLLPSNSGEQDELNQRTSHCTFETPKKRNLDSDNDSDLESEEDLKSDSFVEHVQDITTTIMSTTTDLTIITTGLTRIL